MPKVKRSRKPPPDGWELIEPTLDELDQKMREGTPVEDDRPQTHGRRDLASTVLCSLWWCSNFNIHFASSCTVNECSIQYNRYTILPLISPCMLLGR